MKLSIKAELLSWLCISMAFIIVFFSGMDIMLGLILLVLSFFSGSLSFLGFAFKTEGC